MPCRAKSPGDVTYKVWGVNKLRVHRTRRKDGVKYGVRCRDFCGSLSCKVTLENRNQDFNQSMACSRAT